MKKIWKLNNKAVSPVIATILMVAITVVLAAVLYVMVMGFGGDTTSAPAVTLTQMSTSTGVDVVISISETTDVGKIGIRFSNDTTTNAFTSISGWYNVTQANPAFVSTGDRISVYTGDVPAGTTLQLVWMPNGINGSGQQFVGTVITF